MDLDQVCKNVMDLDDKIRFAGVISDRGRLVAGGMKNGVQQLEDSRTDEMLFMELALRVRMRREFDESLGKVNFSLSYRDKVIVMSFPMDGMILLTSAERDMDFTSIPFKILEILRQYTEQKQKEIQK